MLKINDLIENLNVSQDDILDIMQSLDFGDCFGENLYNGYYNNKPAKQKAINIILYILYSEVCKYSFNCGFLLDNLKEKLNITDEEIENFEY